MIDIIVLISAFLVGFLRNLVREFTSENSLLHKYAAYFFGALYGVLFSWIISQEQPLLTALWLGLLVALMVSNKMTHFAHILGLTIIILVLGTQRLADIPFLFFYAFVLIALIDEFAGVKRIKRKDRTFKRVLMQFVGLELVALVVSFSTGLWIIFFSILLYDIGFILVELLIVNPKKRFLDPGR